MGENRSVHGVRATGRNGVVTATSRETVEAGLGILASGGNAADAAAAALLTACVTRIGAVCLGGEAAVIVFDASSGTTRVLAAQGAAPGDPRAIDWILAHDLPQGSLRAATTPALLDLCVTLLREYGSMTFAEVAAPALSLLDRGRPVAYFDTSLRKLLDALTGDVATLGGDAAPVRDWSADLARTLQRLVHAERSAGARLAGLEAMADRFRTGDIADDLAAWYQHRGGLLRRQDLEVHRTTIEPPLAVDYRGYQVCKADTWTQGLWLLQALRMLDGLDLDGSPADRCHTIAEVIKLALADRDHHFGDPRFVDVPTTGLLSDEYAALRRGLVDPAVAAAAAAPGDPVDMRARVRGRAVAGTTDSSTIACITADRFGNMVVMTPSGVGSMAGSGGSTGITHGTRLKAASTVGGHPNCIAAGKRPCVTLSPTLVLRSGRPFLAMSAPGGSFQDQVALHMILEFVDRGARVADAIERDARAAPVMVDRVSGHSGLRVQRALPASLLEELAKRGHRVEPSVLSFHTLGGCLVFVDPDTGELDAFGSEAAAC